MKYRYLLSFAGAALFTCLTTGGQCPPARKEVVEVDIQGPRDVIKYWCARDQRCQDIDGKGYYSEQACLDYLNAAADCGTWGSANTPRYRYLPTDPDASTCARWLATASCDVPYVDASCNNAFQLAYGDLNPEYVGKGQACGISGISPQGMIATGPLCLYPFECNRSLDNGACGICAGPSALGEPCDPTAGCLGGSYCDNGTCVALKEVDAPCSGSGECKTWICTNGACAVPAARNAACGVDNPCRGALSCVGGVCTDAPGIDEPCTGSGPYSDCQGGLTCHRGTCTPYKLCEYAAIGEPCGVCVAGASCDAAINECVAQLPVGSTCSQTVACVPEAYCLGTDHCTAYSSANEPCVNAWSCKPGESWCDVDAGTCVPYRETGASCTTDSDCETFVCDPSGHVCVDRCLVQ